MRRVAVYRDTAVVLRVTKLGEADRIVTLLTRRQGRVRAVAKGVRRTKSRFGGRLEPFSHVDLQLYEGRNLDIVTQAETLDPFGPALASDYSRYTCATAIAETAERLTAEEREPAMRLYLLVVSALRAVTEQGRDPSLVLDAFLLRAMALAGWAPALRECARCGEPGPHAAFHVAVRRAALSALPGRRIRRRRTPRRRDGAADGRARGRRLAHGAGKPGPGAARGVRSGRRAAAVAPGARAAVPDPGRSGIHPNRPRRRRPRCHRSSAATRLVTRPAGGRSHRRPRRGRHVRRAPAAHVRTAPRAPTPHASGARPPVLPAASIPRHVALVMDGNGRWAKARGLPRTEGHKRGEAALFDVVEGAIELGVTHLSAYAFSTENWKRSPDEVRFLMGFNRDVIRRRRDDMHALGVRVRWAGRRPRLWRSVVHELEVAEQLTADNHVLTLTMCVNYGGRAEIADAARAIARGRGGRPDRPGEGGRTDAGPVPRRTGHAGRRPVPALLGGAADEQLPDLAVRVRRAGVPRHAVPRLRPAATSGGRARSTRPGSAGSAGSSPR